MTFSIRTIRTLILAALFSVALAVSSVASARPPLSTLTQATTATPMDSSQPVKLEFGKAFETLFDGADLYAAYFQFKGKANQLIDVTVDKTAGTFAYTVRVISQSDVDLAYLGGTFVESLKTTVKLPQDGNYRITVTADKPGAGDLEKGTVKVLVDEAKKPVPAAATATK